MSIIFREERSMSTTAHAPSPRAAVASDALPRVTAGDDVGRQAFAMLRAAFTVAPIAFGIDKFLNVMVDWPRYLAPWINDVVPGSGQDLMYVVGAVEIIAGIVVAIRPRIGAPLVAAWLAGIIFNLLTAPGWYDIALRDFGLMLGALTLARLAWHYDTPAARARGRGSAPRPAPNTSAGS
jgi:hypothetical protein